MNEVHAMSDEQEVAGIRCGAVLEQLSAYVDGELAAEEEALIEAHLRGCDWCEHFGGRFADTVRSLRASLGEPEPLETAIARRLSERLERELA